MIAISAAGCGHGSSPTQQAVSAHGFRTRSQPSTRPRPTAQPTGYRGPWFVRKPGTAAQAAAKSAALARAIDDAAAHGKPSPMPLPPVERPVKPTAQERERAETIPLSVKSDRITLEKVTAGDWEAKPGVMDAGHDVFARYRGAKGIYQVTWLRRTSPEHILPPLGTPNEQSLGSYRRTAAGELLTVYSPLDPDGSPNGYWVLWVKPDGFEADVSLQRAFKAKIDGTVTSGPELDDIIRAAKATA